MTNETSGFRDSAFKNNKDLALHRWVPWIAGFSAEFVDDCLRRYLYQPVAEGKLWPPISMQSQNHP
jgi:hypothetical protein